MAGREDARRNRAEGRERRRKDAKPETASETDEQDGSSSEGDSAAAVKQAAKVAAVGAAVGAATAAARAFATQDRGDDEAQPADREQDGSAVEEPVAESEETSSEETQADGEAERDEAEETTPAAESSRDGQDETAEPDKARDEQVSGVDAGQAADAASKAREQLQALLGRDAESVSALERTRDGWLATLEVVELERVPNSTDVLASYEVDLDSDLGLRRYARVGRYTRSQAERGGRE